MNAAGLFRKLVASLRQPGGFVWALADQAMLSLANFGLSIAMGRYASPDDYGLYVPTSTLVILANTAVLGPLVLTPMLFVAAQKEPAERTLYLRQTAALCACITALCVAGFLIASGALFLSGARSYASAAFLAAIVTAFSNVRYLIRCYHIMHARFDLASRNDGIVLVGISLGALILIAAGGLSVWSAMTLSAASELLAVVVFVASRKATVTQTLRELSRMAGGGWKAVVQPTLRENVRFGRWLLFTAAASFALMRAQFLVLPAQMSLPAVAAYHASFLLLQPMFLLATGIEAYAWTRALSAFKTAGVAMMRRRLYQLALSLSILVALYTVVVGLTAKPLVAVLFQRKFEAETTAVWLFGLAALSLVWSKLQATGIMVVQNTRVLFFTNVPGSAVSVLLLFVLVPWFGATGAAASYCLGSLLVTGAQAVYLWRTSS